MVAPAMIGQALGSARGVIGVQPVVDAGPGGAQQPRDLRDRATLGGFEHRERATEDPRIRGLPKLLFEFPTLGCCQDKVSHSEPRFPEDTSLQATVNVQHRTRLEAYIERLALHEHRFAEAAAFLQDRRETLPVTEYCLTN